LGFAVAVHSPARLLLVDEVLSVGNKLFKQKCLDRNHHLRDRGTTNDCTGSTLGAGL